MVLAYDGSGFHGFARQPGQRTVAGELARAISKFSRHGVELVCAGRTDSGVHAHGQVVHTDLAPSVDLDDLKRSVNRQLAPAIVLRSVERAPAGFDARRSALSRSYRYLVFQAAEPDPLLSTAAWHVPDPLDLRMMRAASDGLIGEHDFSAFCRKPPGHPEGAPITRRVVDANWSTASYLNGEPVVVLPPDGPIRRRRSRRDRARPYEAVRREAVARKRGPSRREDSRTRPRALSDERQLRRLTGRVARLFADRPDPVGATCCPG
jgi:tRNA pseudouridine38-40 synthase